VSLYNIKWQVEEIVSGPGQHDGDVRDGDRRTVATGDVVKDGASEDELRSELTRMLEQVYPRHAYGPTYELDRIYHIEINALGGS
jgi:hypothetical protein